MKKKRLGFLTTPGTIATLMTMIIVVGVGSVFGGVLFSPGPLNATAGASLGGATSHADLSNKCGSCHVAFWDQTGMSNRCLVCHTDIPMQWGDMSTLHGNLHKNNPTLACQNCHPDHRGPNASLTDMSKVDVSHEAFGYALTAHQAKTDGSPFACVDCHTNRYTKFDQTICITCHEQIKADFMQTHIQTYGSGCLGCHDGIDTYGHKFDHNNVAFQLTGKHIQIACAQCHTGARTIADLRSTLRDCNSCHAKDDAHNGQFSTNCAACHSTAGWLPASFDHNLSSFKLTGKHASVLCAGCHINNVFKGTPTDCYSCHAKDDAHNGQFGTDCAGCHTTAGWLPATFDHNLASFKLTGKHASVPCTSCHINNIFKGTPSDCYACHAKDDNHKGQFGTACEACHTTSGWLPATFDHSKFPLNGGHAGLACTSCHKNGVFTGLSSACASCHADPPFHAGLFAGTACNQCHSTSAWSPASYNGPHPGGCDGNCINHRNASCRDCHTSNLMTATCTKCHDSNTPGDGGGG